MLLFAVQPFGWLSWFPLPVDHKNSLLSLSVYSRRPEAVQVGEFPLERSEGHPHPKPPEQGGRGPLHPAHQHQVGLRLVLRLYVRQR